MRKLKPSALLCGVLLLAALVAYAALVRRPSLAHQEMPLAELLSSAADGNSGTSHRPWSYRFPRDHGPHPGFPAEMWRISGYVRARDDREFAFQVILNRLAPKPEAVTMARTSRWAVSQIFRGQFALTDVMGGRFAVAERSNRDGLELAGADGPESARIWIEDWTFTDTGNAGDNFRLEVAQDALSMRLDMKALKPLYTQDLANAGLHAYSMPRLSAAGHITLNQKDYPVTGAAWIDRAWGDIPVFDRGQIVWDSFMLHMGEDTELALLRMRRRDGSGRATSSGVLIDKAGAGQTLERGQANIEVLDHWRSRHSGVSYPSKWRIKAGPYAFDVAAAVADQEFRQPRRLWRGLVQTKNLNNGLIVVGFAEVNAIE